MPLYVRATPAEPGKKDFFGPWPESRVAHVVNFAKISSKKSNVRKTREVVWVCGKSAPIVFRVYHDGQRTFPKGRQGDRDGKLVTDLYACMARSQAVCGRDQDANATAKQILKGKKRVLRPPCPVNTDLPKRTKKSTKTSKSSD